jgi:hypothetical protein
MGSKIGFFDSGRRRSESRGNVPSLHEEQWSWRSSVMCTTFISLLKHPGQFLPLVPLTQELPTTSHFSHFSWLRLCIGWTLPSQEHPPCPKGALSHCPIVTQPPPPAIYRVPSSLKFSFPFPCYGPVDWAGSMFSSNSHCADKAQI